MAIPRLRAQALPDGKTLIVFDRAPDIEHDVLALADWNAARSWLMAMGYVPLRFTYEVELGDPS